MLGQKELEGEVVDLLATRLQSELELFRILSTEKAYQQLY